MMLADLQAEIEIVVQAACEKFGIIHPKDCHEGPVPEGKIKYWDWYKKMEELAIQKEKERNS